MQSKERGASMVEMSMVLPLFLLLIYGIMEFSFALAQNNEVRHVAHYAAREAAVTPGADPLALVCDGLTLVDRSAISNVSLTPASAAVGDTVRIDVSADYNTLTGFFAGMFAGTTLDTSHHFVVEQPFGGTSSWPAGGAACP